MPKRQTYHVSQIDDWQGPVQQNGPTRDAAAERVRDRFARMSPTERVASAVTERPPTPPAPLPLRENPQSPRPMPPTAGRMLMGAGLGALEALDQPPAGMPAGAPYTTPLRLLTASAAVPSALAARAYDASPRGSVMAEAPVVDPLRPAEDQSMFSSAIAQRGGGTGAQTAGLVADLLTPDLTDLATGGIPLAAFGSLRKVAPGSRTLVNGLYSRLDEAAQMVPAKGVPATAVMNWLKKAPEGISLEEAAWRKLPEWLESQGTKTVTPEMLQAHLKAHPAPFPKVATLGGEPSKRVSIRNKNGINLGYYDSRDDAERALRKAAAAGPIEDGRYILDAPSPKPTKFSRYQVPGGENYRETLQTLPVNPSGSFGDYARRYREIFDTDKTDAEIRAYWEAGHTLPATGNVTSSRDPGMFVSSHFPDDPNLLVHTRANDRTLPTGEPGRYVEEVQSDWHQQAKEKGYRGPVPSRPAELPTGMTIRPSRRNETKSIISAAHKAEYDRVIGLHLDRVSPGDVPADVVDLDAHVLDSFQAHRLPDEQKYKQWLAFVRRSVPDAFERDPYRGAASTQGYGVMRDGRRVLWEETEDAARRAALDLEYEDILSKHRLSVPDAPFKDAWPDLGLKQQLVEAANDPQAEWLGFTGGKTQADRYDLSKQVKRVYYLPQTQTLRAMGLDGSLVLDEVVPPDKVSDFIGKDAARKLFDQPQKEVWRDSMRSMQGHDLSGLDLQVGGEGMTAFYDQKLPKRLEKIVKPFGGKVESGSVTRPRITNRREELIQALRENDPNGTWTDADNIAEFGRPASDEALEDAARAMGLSGLTTKADSEASWFSRLTPEMKAAMRQRGFPLMSVAAPAAALGIPDDPNSDWDEAARIALMGGSMAALGMAAKGMTSRGGASGVVSRIGGPKTMGELASQGRMDGRTLAHLDLAPASTDAMGHTLVSTRVPGGRDAVASSEPLSTGLAEVQRNPELLDKLAAKIRTYPQVTAKEASRSSASIVESFIDTSRRNLEFLFKEMAPWRERSRQWYVGANKVSRSIAGEYGISPDQSSAVIAILSPQKDWHQNAEMARRLIKNYRDFNAGDPSFTSDTFNHYVTTRTKSLESTIKESLKKKEGFTVEDAAVLRAELQDEIRGQQSLIGRPWSELNRSERAAFLRAHDEFVNGQSYPVLFPEGDIAMAAARTKAGKPSKMAWQSYAQIEKALGVLDDGSIENISRSLGNEHKVRSFFNNINRPEHGRLIGERGASTVDTHQVAGSLLQPMGASSPAVKYAMGGASDAALGLSGSNPLYQEALSRMAYGTEYLPREMQSITWEGLKGLFSPSQKRNADFTVKINKLWKEYKAGRLSLERVQDAVLNEAGGITAPEWSRQ